MNTDLHKMDFSISGEDSHEILDVQIYKIYIAKRQESGIEDDD